MNVQSAVRQQLGFWHSTLGEMVADCGDDLLHKTLPGATITPIASIYAHIVFGNDALVQSLLQGKPVLCKAEGWESKTGVTFPGLPPAITPEWGMSIRMNLPAFQRYAAAVHNACETYLAGLPDADLERKVTGSFGEQTVEWILVNVLGTHAAQHAGEIAAIKGVHGLKGLPF